MSIFRHVGRSLPDIRVAEFGGPVSVRGGSPNIVYPLSSVEGAFCHVLHSGLDQ